MKSKTVVLLSAGLDSTVNFYAALQETDVQMAITFNYGQRAAEKEIERSQKLTQLNKVKHTVIDLPWLKSIGNSSLTHAENKIPLGQTISLDNKNVSDQTAKSVWVPNRNGIFLNIAAAYAEGLDVHFIVPGFNAEEAATFPDNSADFIQATQKTFYYSTANHVDVKCYTIHMSKLDIVKLGQNLKVPFEKIWPCYLSQDKWCGQCESCQRAHRAFKLSGVDVQPYFEKL